MEAPQTKNWKHWQQYALDLEVWHRDLIQENKELKESFTNVLDAIVKEKPSAKLYVEQIKMNHSLTNP